MKRKADIISNLRQHIGRYARHEGTVFEIIEILEDEPALVLQDCEQRTTIQADQHGEAHRRVPQTCTITIPVDENGNYNISEVGIELI
jgi:hypothetical protein